MACGLHYRMRSLSATTGERSFNPDAMAVSTTEILSRRKRYQVLGIDISDYSREEFLQLVEERLTAPAREMAPIFVVTVNPEIVVQSIIDNEFKQILAASSINTADGIGISWAVNFLYGTPVERITGSDSMKQICEICARYEQPVFLYGAAPNVAERAAEVLQHSVHGLRVSGVFSPDHNAVPLEELPGEVQERMRESSVIFVALGAPGQEKWIYHNMRKLPECKLFIGIGGSFDFVAGTVKRAPGWMCRSGLEWLYRLYLQPSRWRRMLKLPLFAINVLLLKPSTNVKQKPLKA